MGAEPTVREAAEALIHALDRHEKQTPNFSAEIVMRRVKPVLELAARSFPRSDDRRDAKAALKMVCAELGIDHE